MALGLHRANAQKVASVIVPGLKMLEGEERFFFFFFQWGVEILVHSSLWELFKSRNSLHLSVWFRCSFNMIDSDK